MSHDADIGRRAVVSAPLDLQPVQPLSSAISVEIAAASVCGLSNTENSDQYMAIRSSRSQETLLASLGAADLPQPFQECGYVMIVADGLGEGAIGARASRLTLSALAHMAIEYGKWNIRVTHDSPHEIQQQGEFLIRSAHQMILDASRAHMTLVNMATSLTALYIIEDRLFFAHVGHATAFLYREGGLIRLTTSHTLDDPGPVSPFHPRAEHGLRDRDTVVTEAIGARGAGPEFDIEHCSLASGDRLLLCTNGLTDVVTTEQIADALAARHRPQDDCEHLIDLAVTAGRPDDVTVMLADYSIRR